MSIRHRLAVWLLSTVLAAGLAASAVVFFKAREEANELFDYQLRQMALTLRDRTYVPSQLAEALQGEDALDFVIQVWGPDGTQLYNSHPNLRVPGAAQIGFADVVGSTGRWRVFTIQQRGLTIQVAQTTSNRSELAFAAAWRTLIPFLIARATRMVEQLLALARQDPDAPVENTAPVDLAQLAASVAHEQEPAAAAKGLVLAAEIAEPVMITGNHDALHAMLDNLVDNAIRYTPSGHVVVRAARGGDDAILEVEDTGPGIPATERTRVFDRFYRSESASQGGSGLGLAIVRRIAERHGGRAELLDAPTGLRVRITLPGR